jgi:tRNA threonylcarbamoyladenosine biosynthesis protein TsaB
MMQLSIDTSTRYASLALAKAGEVIAEFSWYSNQNHTVELVPSIELLLQRHNVDYMDLSVIGLAIGPGNFSAVRVAVSVAKGLSTALSVPLAPVSSLLIEAYPYLSSDLLVCAVIGAGRGQVITASYQMRDGIVTVEAPMRLSTIDQLVESSQSRSFLCGEGMNGMTEEEIAAAKETFIMTSPRMLPSRRASSIIHLLSDGYIDVVPDAAGIEPSYARDVTIIQPRSK